jgi:copper chaperone
MNTLKFKTNINCSGCIGSVTPHLNAVEGINWQVDTTNPDKILTVETENESIAADKIKQVVEKAGFKIETLS